MLCSIAASAAIAQPPALDDAKRTAQTDCGSVVIIKCDRPAPVGNTSASEQARQQSRRIELRRQDPPIQALDGVVIEADVVRRRSIEETMGSAFPIVRPRDGSYTFETGEGSKCTCMNVCPPWPLPCCQCSAEMSRYRSTPGSAPL